MLQGRRDNGAGVFIACFSSHSAAREQSYQNEELLLGIEQLRRRRPDGPWLIPVRFDNCDVPDYELGASRTLASLHRADLFGANRDLEAQRLVEAVLRCRPSGGGIPATPEDRPPATHTRGRRSPTLRG
jgi:hypothetical protein